MGYRYIELNDNDVRVDILYQKIKDLLRDPQVYVEELLCYTGGVPDKYFYFTKGEFSIISCHDTGVSIAGDDTTFLFNHYTLYKDIQDRNKIIHTKSVLG